VCYTNRYDGEPHGYKLTARNGAAAIRSKCTLFAAWTKNRLRLRNLDDVDLPYGRGTGTVKTHAAWARTKNRLCLEIWMVRHIS